VSPSPGSSSESPVSSTSPTSGWWSVFRAERWKRTLCVCGRTPHAVQDPFDAGSYFRTGPPRPGLVRGCGALCQVKQVGSFGLVELKGSGERLQDSLGNSAQVSSFKPCVILGADAGEHGHFLAFEARYSAGPAVYGKPCLGGGDPRPPAHEELADVLAVVHGSRLRGAKSALTGTASTPHSRYSRAREWAGCLE
jgi:hypothetical protein